MALTTLKPKLATLDTRQVKTLDTKAGTVERERGRAWMAKRQRVALAYGYRCAGCGRVWLSNRDHIDHIVGLEDGGTNDENNLQPLCHEPCHKAKSDEAARRRAGR